jgi:hypothetical protein
MAPEQMFGLRVDSRADLFSVAMVFLDLLTLLPKNPAIPRSSLPEIVNLPPNNRIDYSILYPTALIPVLQKGLAVIQAERYQSAREFVQGIKDVLPRLKTSASRAGGHHDVTAVVQKSTQAPPTNPGDLDSMTNLLVDYVGPIAKNIMVAHERDNLPVSELVNALSREIPKPEERQEFLKRWEVISGTRLDSTQFSSSATRTKPLRSFNDDVLRKMSTDYAEYIGPLATRLVQHHAASSSGLEQLVEFLAKEIPDPADRQKFKSRWLQN